MRGGWVVTGVRVLWWAWLGAGVLALLARPALAEPPELAILGLTSDEGDDELAAELTAALRSEVGSDPERRLADTRASLAQMIFSQDCEVTEAECRVRIGRALGADQVIYGSIRRSAAGGHEVELHGFDARDGAQVSARRSLPAADAGNAAALAAHARALLLALRGEPEPAPDREQHAPAVPTITPDVQPLEATQRETPAEASETVFDDEVTSSNDWLGYTLLGVAAVSAGLTVFSWAQISDAQDDVAAYREAVFNANRRDADICPLADAGMRFGLSAEEVADTSDACGRGQTFEVLQYVFIGAALVSAGFGTYLLLDEEEQGARAARPKTLSLRTQVGRDRAMAGVSFAF